MKRIRLTILLFLTTISMTILTGCDDIQIFKTETDPYAQVALKDTQLENGSFYVKNNTRFYKVYAPKEGSASSSGASALNESRVLATMQDDALIPTHYKDEFIALQSDDISFSEVNLERFQDLGYSIGCYNGSITDDGYLYFNHNSGLVHGSSLDQVIGTTQAVDIRIASIDGKQLQVEQINTKAGIITGLEKDKHYKVGYYVGTKYYEKNVIADCKMYQAYEMFSYGDLYITDTPNGYMSFNTPQDLKAGYYNINGSGLFRYYDFIRGTQNESEAEMNISYYADEKSKIEAYSRQYSISVPKRVKDLRIIVKLNSIETEYVNDLIQGIVFAPNGERMNMEYDEKEKEISIALAEGMAGDWTVNVIPKTLDIKDVLVEKDEVAEEATCEETIFTLPEGRENIEFIAEYTSYKSEPTKCTVFGTILSEDGKTYEMKTWVDDSDSQKLRYYISYEVPYAKAGEYIMRVYHYPEETAIMPAVVQDKVEVDTEIIVIDG